MAEFALIVLSSYTSISFGARSLGMTLSEAPGAVKQFRKKAWRFQQTFQTPLKNLQAFVRAIVSGRGFDGGCLTIDQVVFEPKHLIKLLSSYPIEPDCERGTAVSAHGHEEVVLLLEAALSDSLDFIFIPEPKPFAIFADHDDYTTFFANTRSNLNGVITNLSAHGFKAIQNYERHL